MLVAAAVLVSGAGGGAVAITVDIGARALTPGELLVLNITVDGEPRTVHVSLFGKDLSAFRLSQGRWQALGGIDLDQRPGRYPLTVVTADDRGTQRHAQDLVVAAKRFPTRKLAVSPDFVNPPPSQLKKIEEDSAFLRQVFATSAETRLWSAPFVRPVAEAANSRFGSRSVFNGEPRSPHGGADFLSPAGTPIKAPNSGRVVCARDLFFSGKTVIVDHGLGVFSTLAHLSRIDVQEGGTVTAGQVVGLVGATGRVTGPHLHWAVAVLGARVDPLSVLTLLGA
jgi:murein DD-endopeptidase MepM/ murein hydrolase activator NlpD